jgi:hypothetical protein
VASTRPTVDPESFILRTGSGLLDGQTCTREALTFPACSALSSLCSLIADPSPPPSVVPSSPGRLETPTAGSYRSQVKYEGTSAGSESSLPLTHAPASSPRVVARALAWNAMPSVQ